ncbi:MAG: imidazole glycerol phosphate synthase subunit HisH [Anaerolineae bacterium]|nr:imidazole glycerol phosphate synthase subunit HisH [Anaerolineae bacterium]MBT4309376.1 imidazole glycerol phosphate synthase subunit HisH [Anaerolineae bacterium]MBT4459216.1 imidazole glycerol phosphate synthase subunit HisH [Anaerolineae bacterium]MBT6061410.1 imidazole glycerol phosphate synthase subunit HisH [Anaerolineae bacterium]MBT6322456.1 imidazole glycerol phosphate synthase subunit HisH [Anaerolineae bacterium]
MIAIIDYGAGNLHSVQKAIEFVGGQAQITNSVEKILTADKTILPGVGAFKDGMDGLEANNLIPVIKEFAASGKPLLGICLGMQLFFDEGHEHGIHEGLGILPGRVLGFDFEDKSLKIPQIGWNTIAFEKENPLTSELPDESYVYFNHGYYCETANAARSLASTEYGIKFTSIVNAENIYGVQFHPEKSQKIGLQILRNFVEKI